MDVLAQINWDWLFVGAAIVALLGVWYVHAVTENRSGRHGCASGVIVVCILVMAGMYIYYNGLHISGTLPTIDVQPHPTP
ncbi:MAG TPA: hypothetical protein VM536_08230 [Chloroflexia bacterium]|nr:hypothetical protein [Chloroflexia bacterium]